MDVHNTGKIENINVHRFTNNLHCTKMIMMENFNIVWQVQNLMFETLKCFKSFFFTFFLWLHWLTGLSCHVNVGSLKNYISIKHSVKRIVYQSCSLEWTRLWVQIPPELPMDLYFLMRLERAEETVLHRIHRCRAKPNTTVLYSPLLISEVGGFESHRWCIYKALSIQCVSLHPQSAKLTIIVLNYSQHRITSCQISFRTM